MTLAGRIAWDDTVLPFQLDRADIRGRVGRNFHVQVKLSAVDRNNVIPWEKKGNVLADTIEQLGDKADLPSHDDLKEVLPGIIERHGLAATRMMLASAVAGDAPEPTRVSWYWRPEAVVVMVMAGEGATTPAPEGRRPDHRGPVAIATLVRDAGSTPRLCASGIQ